MKRGTCPKCNGENIVAPKIRKRVLKHIGFKSEEYLCKDCGYVEVYKTVPTGR
jgi:predicted nucleic-acid-binding Zn-ribbon protein